MPAHAAVEQDQSYTAPLDSTVTVSSTIWQTQSFTAGISGPLSRVDLLLGYNTGSGNVDVLIYSADVNGQAVGGPIATELLTASTLPANPAGTSTAVVFTSPATVTAGQRYTIMVSANGTVDARWTAIGGTTTYTGGVAWTTASAGGSWVPANGYTFSFVTFVGLPDAAAAVAWTVKRQSTAMPDSGTCVDVADDVYAYGTDVYGGWQRAWEFWVTKPNPEVRGGWACSRALVNKGGTAWVSTTLSCSREIIGNDYLSTWLGRHPPRLSRVCSSPQLACSNWFPTQIW